MAEAQTVIRARSCSKPVHSAWSRTQQTPLPPMSGRRGGSKRLSVSPSSPRTPHQTRTLPYGGWHLADSLFHAREQRMGHAKMQVLDELHVVGRNHDAGIAQALHFSAGEAG